MTIDKKMVVAGNPCDILTVWPYPLPSEELHPRAEIPRRVEFGCLYEYAGIKGRLCLWLDEPSLPVEVSRHTRDGHVHIYHCNDGYPDEDFDDIVFRVERL